MLIDDRFSAATCFQFIAGSGVRSIYRHGCCCWYWVQPCLWMRSVCLWRSVLLSPAFCWLKTEVSPWAGDRHRGRLKGSCLGCSLFPSAWHWNLGVLYTRLLWVAAKRCRAGGGKVSCCTAWRGYTGCVARNGCSLRECCEPGAEFAFVLFFSAGLAATVRKRSDGAAAGHGHAIDDDNAAVDDAYRSNSLPAL